MKAKVNKETCIGCGLCPSVCPEVFQMEDDGKAEVLTPEVPDNSKENAKEAESGCPVGAILVEE